MSKISFKILIQLHIFMLLGRCAPILSKEHQSSLCKPKDMPCKPDNPEVCFMKYYTLNSTECRDMTFSGRSHFNENYLGTVELKSYVYELMSFKTTGFNITFKNIKWKHLKFRFMELGYDMKNTCREFFIAENATENELFYDCLWSKETYEGHPFLFEYEASDNTVTTYKKFSFVVPCAFNIDEGHTDVENWEIFTYVELMPEWCGLSPSKVILHWQPLPEKYSIESYLVYVIARTETETKELIYGDTIKCNDNETCKYVFKQWIGKLRFGVQPLCKNDTRCGISYTMTFELVGRGAKALLVGVACIIIIGLVLWFIYSKIKKLLTRKIVSSMKSYPKVLIIYSSSVTPHANAVLNLAEYLHSYCKVEPLVDELHIPLSKTKDPFKWCNQSFKEADVVMIVASPRFGCGESSNSIYRNTDTLLLRMLRENLGSHSDGKKYFLLMMPYSQNSDVPKEARNLKKFYFPDDLNKILRFIHGCGILPSLFSCQFPGGKKSFHKFGRNLHNAIVEAKEYLNSETGSVEESIIEDDICSEHEMLTIKQNYTDTDDLSSQECKIQLKEKAKDVFGEYPGPLEGINLLNDEKEIEKASSFPPKKMDKDIVGVDINQLNL